MSTLPRVLVSVGAIALVVCVCILHGAVRTLKTTVQGHTATLNTPVIEGAVFPGVPAAFADRWHTATHSTDLAPQDSLWLTLHLTNRGQSQLRSITADLVLVPTIHAIYPSETLVGTPAVVTASTGQTRATFSFLSLALGHAHTVFIALRPDGLAGPPYEAPAQRQWVVQHRAYWEHCTVTAGEHTTLVQYGFASSVPVQQTAGGSTGASAPAGVPRSAAHRAP